MSERIIGIGKAVVDEKIRDSSVILPPNSELFTFLDGFQNSERSAGGVTPNILAAFTDFSTYSNLKLIACIGNDNRGQYYASRNPSNLGPLQIDKTKRTAVSVEVIDNKGSTVRYGWNYDAADSARVEKQDLENRHALIVSDTTVLGVSDLFNEIDKVLKHPTNNSAAFFLNLCGLSDLYSPDEVRSMFSSLKKQPDIVTGNKEEVSYLSEALGFPPDEVLPNARLLVTTLAEQGSLVRFERDLHHIPAVNVSQETYKNETGCGDAYAGIMLGSLFKEEYNQWSRDQVLSSCKTASFGASLVAQSMDTRLNTQEMAKVKKYHEI